MSASHNHFIYICLRELNKFNLWRGNHRLRLAHPRAIFWFADYAGQPWSFQRASRSSYLGVSLADLKKRAPSFLTDLDILDINAEPGNRATDRYVFGVLKYWQFWFNFFTS